jgi:hypothetical protein
MSCCRERHIPPEPGAREGRHLRSDYELDEIDSRKQIATLTLLADEYQKRLRDERKKATSRTQPANDNVENS